MIASIVAFCSLGALNVTQELAGAILRDIEGADPDLVAEETLCLVTIVTLRAAQAGLREWPDAVAAAEPVLAALPYTYRRYLTGLDMLDRNDPSLAEPASVEAVDRRLQRKQRFYEGQFPEATFPGEEMLTSGMELWMGRISPPKLPETPSVRLRKMGLARLLGAHLRVVGAYCRNVVASEKDSAGGAEGNV